MRPRFGSAILIAALLLTGSGCSSGDDVSETGAPGTTDAANAAGAPGSTDGAAEDGTGCVAEPAATGVPIERTITHDGLEREYTVHVPPGRDEKTPIPAIVNLHGLTSNAAQQDAFSNLPEAAGERGYAVISPQGLVTRLPIAGGLDATYWNVAPAVDTSEVESPGLAAADDLGFVEALLDEESEALCLDPDRLYTTGMSNGAAMAIALICATDRFAAAAPVAGANFVSACDTDDPPPIIAFHGTDDVLAPYEGGDVFGFPLDLPGAVEQMADLATRAGCELVPAVDSIGDDVERRQWVGCPPDEAVTLYTVLGGGHTWPGLTTYLDADALDGGTDATVLGGISLADVLGTQTETIVATDLILDFFDEHAV